MFINHFHMYFVQGLQEVKEKILECLHLDMTRIFVVRVRHEAYICSDGDKRIVSINYLSFSLN